MDLSTSLNPSVFCTSVEVISEGGSPLGILTLSDAARKKTITEGAHILLQEDRRYLLSIVPNPKCFSSVAIVAGPIEESPLSSAACLIYELDLSQYVGEIAIEFQGRGEVISKRISFISRPRKLEFETDFKLMVAEICSASLDLLLSLRNESAVRVSEDTTRSPVTLLQQLVLIRHIFESGELQDALAEVIGNPKTLLRISEDMVPISQARHSSRSWGRAVASSPDRVPLPSSSALNIRVSSLPRLMPRRTKVETLDIPENRFVKQFITEVLGLLEDSSDLLRYRGRDPELYEWLQETIEWIRDCLNSSFFKALGRASVIPHENTSLQQRSGYKQVYEAWCRYRVAILADNRLLSDAFLAGQRDSATLYEIWCLLLLRKVLLRMSSKEGDHVFDNLLRRSPLGLSLQPVSGGTPVFSFTREVKGNRIRISLFYKRSYSGPVAAHKRGTWSKRMAPDLTVSVVRLALDADDMENNEVNLHFDSKYKCEIDPDTGMPAEAAGHKADDLDKMHAYLGAIHRSIGAFVLYPGKVCSIFERDGKAVGAIAARPSKSEYAAEEIEKVVDAMLLRNTCV